MSLPCSILMDATVFTSWLIARLFNFRNLSRVMKVRILDFSLSVNVDNGRRKAFCVREKQFLLEINICCRGNG